MASYKERLQLFQALLAPDTGLIHFEQLRRVCYRGIPDSYGIRQKCWKLLLNFLPSDVTMWSQVTREKRQTYYTFVKDLCCPSDDKDADSSRIDRDLIETIDKDVRRTLADMSFFHMGVQDSEASPLPPRKRFLQTIAPVCGNADAFTAAAHQAVSPRTADALPTSGDKHFEAIERILYIFAKLNPGVGYIQGMNHVIFPLYFLMATDQTQDGRTHAEPDTFFLFHEVMTDYRDWFITSMDADSSTGINQALKSMTMRLQNVDPALASDLADKSLDATFYAFRWYTCLCAQEFDLPDTIRLWDSLFADRAAARARGVAESALYCLDTTHPLATPSPDKDCVCNVDVGVLELDGYVHTTPLAEKPAEPLQTQEDDKDIQSTAFVFAHAANPPSYAEINDPTHASRQGHFLTDFLVCLLTTIRTDLMNMPFDEALQLLQDHPVHDVDPVLREAYSLAQRPDGDAAPTAAKGSGQLSAFMSALSKGIGSVRSNAASPAPEASTEIVQGHGRTQSLGTWMGFSSSRRSPPADESVSPPLPPHPVLGLRQSKHGRSGSLSKIMDLISAPPATPPTEAAQSLDVGDAPQRKPQPANLGMMWTRLKSNLS
ncbi:hypothetical protein RI367_003358 [Sorochytrium milnesiophthora]